MHIKNRILAIGYRSLLVATCLYGVALNLYLGSHNLADMFSYYTIQSNIIVLVFFSGLLLYTCKPKVKKPAWLSPTVKGAVTICITLTFLVYHFMLVPTMFTMAAQAYAFSPANVLLHYVTPVMVIVDWLLFDIKGKFGKFDPLKWVAIPFAYLIFSLIRAQFAVFALSNSRYPYFFMDFDKLGAGRVGAYILFISIGYITLGYVFYTVDRLLSKIRRGKR
ncbi:MAG: Pr6Pr family membrane protein [Candidatus Nomurabacteria bacterium]|jgi:hypothetical protein|nr:Pr6Pr family membrane protein [Candidatus Nomurabacteria bacterium]